MGPAGSANWTAMLDGAEDILREEGYAALTSRRVAERIGVKQRLVYYYFHTMDDLIVATFRRLSEREVQRLGEAFAAERPLREAWDICIHSSDTRIVSEFMALANRIPDLRDEVIDFIERSRQMQIAAISQSLERSGCRHGLPPEATALIATSLALALNREAELGVVTGHAEAIAAVEQFLAGCEPQGPSRRVVQRRHDRR
jgi:AcrR family transcriptional regulator